MFQIRISPPDVGVHQERLVLLNMAYLHLTDGHVDLVLRQEAHPAHQGNQPGIRLLVSLIQREEWHEFNDVLSFFSCRLLNSKFTVLEEEFKVEVIIPNVLESMVWEPFVRSLRSSIWSSRYERWGLFGSIDSVGWDKIFTWTWLKRCNLPH